MNTFIVGTLIEIDASFLDPNKNPIDPTVVTAEIRLPDDTVTDLTADIVKRGVGDYYVLFTPTLNGLHQYRFVGTGTANTAQESFFMAETGFPS